MLYFTNRSLSTRLVEQDAIYIHIWQEKPAILSLQQMDGVLEHLELVGVIVVDRPTDVDERSFQYLGRLRFAVVGFGIFVAPYEMEMYEF